MGLCVTQQRRDEGRSSIELRLVGGGRFIAGVTDMRREAGIGAVDVGVFVVNVDSSTIFCCCWRCSRCVHVLIAVLEVVRVNVVVAAICRSPLCCSKIQKKKKEDSSMMTTTWLALISNQMEGQTLQNGLRSLSHILEADLNG